MLDPLSLSLRWTIVDALESAGHGHIGPAFSLVEILRALYWDCFGLTPADWEREDRHRVILSKGHGCLALYAVLTERGFLDREDLMRVGAMGALLGGHPERGRGRGIEASTGSLGHGLAIGVGHALAARVRSLDYRVAVVMGDGELNEGSVWEAALHAAKHRLGNLLVLVDLNGAQCYGPTHQVLDMGPLRRKWESFGFAAEEVDGHDVGAIEAATARLTSHGGIPGVVLCRTVKGKGLGEMENDPAWHYRNPLSAEDVARMRAALSGVMHAAPA